MGIGLALMVLLTTTLLPLAVADHAYSHRYVVYGRVVDANGDPVPSMTVRLGFQDVTGIEGNCANQPGTETEAFGRTETRQVTNEHGEFMFCTHVHQLARSLPGAAIVSVENVNVTEEIDVNFRTSFVVVKLPDVRENANKNVRDTTYTVLGRLWRDSSSDRVEGIRVFGETVDNVPVNITLNYDGKTVKVNTTTNNYGDFAVRVPVESRPTSGTIVVEAVGETHTEEIDPTAGATQMKIETEKAPSALLSGNTLWVIVGIAAAVGIIGLSWFAFRRVAAQREEAHVRATAQRRRSNK